MTNSAYVFYGLISLILITTFSYLDYPITALLMIMASVWVLRKISNREYFQSYSMTNIMLFYLFWLCLVSFTTKVPSVSYASLVVLIGMPLMYLIASNSEYFQQGWKLLSKVIIVVAILVSLLAIWQVHNKIGTGYANGPFNDRNAFAALLNLVWFPIAYLLLVSDKSTSKLRLILLGCVLYIIATAFFATSSRGGILTWFILLPVLMWASYKNTKNYKLIVAVLVTSALAYVTSSFLLHSNISDRNFNFVQDASVFARLYIWKSAFLMALEHPVVGTGWGTFGYFYPAFRLPIEKTTAGFFAHNDYLQFAAEGGFIASLILIGIFGMLLSSLRKHLRGSSSSSFECVALLLGVIALFIHAIVNFIFYFAFMSALSGIYLARVATLSEKPSEIMLPKLSFLRPSIKKLLGIFVIVVFAFPYLIQLSAQLCLTGSRPGLKVIGLFVPKIEPFNVANLITAVYPKDGLAQEYILRTYEYYLTDQGSLVNKKEGADMLLLALNTYDLMRRQFANAAPYGTRQVKMLLENHALYDSIKREEGASNKLAYQILDANLIADPYHGHSMVMLAELQNTTGQKQQALKTLGYASFKVLTIRDQQLVTAERLKLLAPPQFIAELSAIQDKLLLIKSNADGAITDLEASEIYDDVDKRLKEIEQEIES